jgi:hypothetical protein
MNCELHFLQIARRNAVKSYRLDGDQFMQDPSGSSGEVCPDGVKPRIYFDRIIFDWRVAFLDWSGQRHLYSRPSFEEACEALQTAYVCDRVAWSPLPRECAR